MKKPVALIIMDGFGESKNTDGNAIASSNTPNLDKIMNESTMNESFDWNTVVEPLEFKKTIEKLKEFM